jgi:hypothetical protein
MLPHDLHPDMVTQSQLLIHQAQKRGWTISRMKWLSRWARIVMFSASQDGMVPVYCFCFEHSLADRLRRLLEERSDSLYFSFGCRP